MSVHHQSKNRGKSAGAPRVSRWLGSACCVLPALSQALVVQSQSSLELIGRFEHNPRLTAADAVENSSGELRWAGNAGVESERWQHRLSGALHAQHGSRQDFSRDGGSLTAESTRAGETGSTRLRIESASDETRFTLFRADGFSDQLQRQNLARAELSHVEQISDYRQVEATLQSSSIRYDDDPQSPFRDFNTYDAQIRVAQEFSENFAVGVSAFVSRLDVQPLFRDPRGAAQLVNANNRRVSLPNDLRQDALGARVDALLAVNESLTLSGSIGYRQVEERRNVVTAVAVDARTVAVASNLVHGRDSGLVGNVRVVHQGDQTNLEAQVQRSVIPSGLGASEQQDEMKLTAERSISDRLRGSLSIRWLAVDVDEQLRSQRDYEFFETQTAMTYQLSEQWTLSGEYRVRRIDGEGGSNSASDQAVGHEVLMRVSWQDERER